MLDWFDDLTMWTMDTASKLIEIFVYLVEPSFDYFCEQFGQNDLDPNCLTLWCYVWKKILKKNQQATKKHAKYCPASQEWQWHHVLFTK